MDALLILGLLIALALAAPRWGADTRLRLESEEHALASRGVVWEA
jgi:hypothetical protein